MSRSVLCAVDISNVGKDDQVLKTAKRLADLDGAQLDVVTVVPDFGKSLVAGFFDASHHAEALKAAKAELKQQIIASLGPDADAKIRHVVATGTAYEEILRTAKETGCGLPTTFWVQTLRVLYVTRNVRYMLCVEPIKRPK